MDQDNDGDKGGERRGESGRQAPDTFGTGMIETLAASAAVVGHRTRVLLAAAASPLDGDYRELGRMVPEKFDAFARATVSGVVEFWAFQSEAWAAGSRALSMMTSARLPATADVCAMFGHVQRMQAMMAASGTGMLAPIHRRATVNARRLDRAGRRGRP